MSVSVQQRRNSTFFTYGWGIAFRTNKESTSFGARQRPEMEFLDINITKDLSLLIHAVHSPFYLRILKKSLLFSGFKISYNKNPGNKKTQSIDE